MRAVGALGIGVLARVVKAGIAAEALASVGIGLALLLVFREQDFSILTETLGAEALSGGSVAAGCSPRWRWAAGCSSASTPAWRGGGDARRRAPRAARDLDRAAERGVLVILNAVAVTLAHPDPAAIVAGEDIDPVTTAVVASFGSWSAKPFAAVVLVAFLACGMAAQSLTARTIYSMARDDVLPARASCAGSTAAGADRRRSW